MLAQPYEALVCDLDGTLVTDAGDLHPETLAALRAAVDGGLRFMIATGRSEGGIHTIYEQTGILTPALVYNGAGLYCPSAERLIEEQTLSDRTVERTLRFAERRNLLPVVMRFGEKFALPARNAEEEAALNFLEDLRICSEVMPREYLIRITLFVQGADEGERVARELEAEVGHPMYLTYFPLSALAQHRSSELGVIDVQPPCRGKGEALRYLHAVHGIAPERVVAVGDADNDIPMLERAGLSVAMENSMPGVLAVAHRVIGSNNSSTIGDLIRELFL